MESQSHKRVECFVDRRRVFGVRLFFVSVFPPRPPRQSRNAHCAGLRPRNVNWSRDVTPRARAASGCAVKAMASNAKRCRRASSRMHLNKLLTSWLAVDGRV
ncbi:hypothetical protein NDU88_001427 [Pleurodeles waltl]|uniref:Uncharacterized protein n=1 Tax=Pleurodeles waltl TaxID=8319 RepID=A0AAV7LBE6_PLEWA|nr:hypothetical protein NDU88_001427 [Pleurodeles waltl]